MAQSPKPESTRSPATVTWLIDGTPPGGTTPFHLARLALQCTRGISEGVNHIGVKELRSMLVEAGITDPEHTTWSFTLPNGRTIGAVAAGDPIPPAPPKAEKPKGKGKPKAAAERVAAYQAKKAQAASDKKVAEARRTKVAPSAGNPPIPAKAS